MNQVVIPNFDASLPEWLVPFFKDCEKLNGVDVDAAKFYRIEDQTYYVFDPTSKSIHLVDADSPSSISVHEQAFEDSRKQEMFDDFKNETGDSPFYGDNFIEIDREIVYAYFYALVF